MPRGVSWSLLSWNVAGRVALQASQAEVVASEASDVVALQEVTTSTATRWREQLADVGLVHSIFSFDLAPPDFIPKGPRRLGLILAARWPLQAGDPQRFKVPWPEQILSAVAARPNRDFEIHTTHVPPGVSNGWIKIEHLEGLFSGLAVKPVSRPCILCGDFNTPRRELVTGEVLTFAQTEHGRPKPGRGTRWDAAERNILTGLSGIGMPDVYRSLYGYKPQPASWVVKRAAATFGRRFDHVFASNDAKAVSMQYRDEWRLTGLSDHSGLVVTFDP